MLQWATTYFSQSNVPSPRMSIEWLLADVLNVRRLDLYLMYDRPLSPEELDRLRPLIKRRREHEPLQYITGTASFMDCELVVNRHVLIPRIETEQLVDRLLEETVALRDRPLHVLDIGTGSGCIPIAIKKKRPSWSCTGIDLSAEALNVARQNAKLNNTDVAFLEHDLFALDELPNHHWTIIISNPPYITPGDKHRVEEQVMRYEPEIALFTDNPTGVYHSILTYAHQCNSSFFLECSDLTASKVQEMAAGFADDAECLRDLDGKERFVIGGLAGLK